MEKLIIKNKKNSSAKLPEFIILCIKWIKRNFFLLFFLLSVILVFLFICDFIKVDHHFSKDNPKGELIKVCLTTIAGFSAFYALYYSAKRVEVMEKGNADANFKDAVGLLGSQSKSTSIGGAYYLYFAAKEHDKYKVPACEILCTHIRSITKDKDYQKEQKEEPSSEIQTILKLLFKYDDFIDKEKSNKKNQSKKPIFENNWKNLKGVSLGGADFIKTKLFQVSFNKAKLYKVDFKYAKLETTNFNDAKLNNVDFNDAKLNGVNFSNAKLIDVDFSNAEIINVNFSGTVLEGCDDITKKGFSLEKTKQKSTKSADL